MTGHPRARILVAIDVLGPDELEIFATIGERLIAGQAQYGELQLATDRRNFAREALEEVADALVYAAAGLLKAEAVAAHARELAASEEVAPLPKVGGSRAGAGRPKEGSTRGDENQGDIGTLKNRGSNQAEYLVRRLKRDAPEGYSADSEDEHA